MIDRALADAEGIGLLLITAVIGLIAVLVAMAIERSLRPHHERDFPHMATVSKAREQRRREHHEADHLSRIREASDVIIANAWQGPDAERRPDVR